MKLVPHRYRETLRVDDNHDRSESGWAWFGWRWHVRSSIYFVIRFDFDLTNMVINPTPTPLRNRLPRVPGT